VNASFRNNHKAAHDLSEFYSKFAKHQSKLAEQKGKLDRTQYFLNVEKETLSREKERGQELSRELEAVRQAIPRLEQKLRRRT
jgi:predicted RNase H-like nuclease (RuvC/YqgF family)